jgi:glycosyltransferase involved in cell wall biosynthesis
MEMVKIPVELDVYGIPSDTGYRIPDNGYRRAGGGRWKAGCGENPEIRNPESRIRWLQPVKPEAVVETIGKYDALVVPSVWLETGPLVVLEAFAAGVPVIGSRLGGIAEMVRDGVDGFLFKPGNPSDLAYDIEQIPRQLAALRGNIKKPKGLTLVAEEHSCLYQNVV